MRFSPLLALVLLSCVPDVRGATLSALPEPEQTLAHAVAQLRIVGNEAGAYDRGDFRYYTRQSGNGRIFARCFIAGGDEQVLLNENDVDGSLGAMLVSPDDKFVAYSTKSKTGDHYALRVKDIAHDETAAPVVKDADFSFAWDKDELVYARVDELDRPTRVYALTPHSHHLPRLLHEERTNEVLVAPVDHAAALFVRTSSDVLAYRLNPLFYAEGDASGLHDDHGDDAAPVDAGPAVCNGAGTGGVGAVNASRFAP